MTDIYFLHDRFSFEILKHSRITTIVMNYLFGVVENIMIYFIITIT